MDQKIDDLDPNILVLHCYGHWEYVLIDMESTTLLYREVNTPLRSYRSLDNLNLS